MQSNNGAPKENQRVRLTKRLIREGLIRLLEHKELHQITVTELCSLAEINRTTFYKYYENVSDVLSDVASDMENQWELFVEEIHKSPLHNSEKCVLELLNYIRENRRTYLMLFKSKAGHSILLEMVQNTMKFLRNDIVSDDSETVIRNEYIFKYVVSGSTIIIQEWIKSGTKESTEYISALLCELALSLLKTNSDF